MELMQASRQWATRPFDERFLSLYELGAKVGYQRQNSAEKIVPSKSLKAVPDNDYKGLRITGPSGNTVELTNYAFGQIATLANAPAGYLRKLPSPIAADAINYGMNFLREIDDVGVLLTRVEGNGVEMRAATGPRYGRVWNSEIVNSLINHFGDGVTGDWKVPGEWGKDVQVTRENTTLYASDRDMFVFLCDEKHKLQIDNRRHGKHGGLSRGFFVWNSEVGDKTLGMAMFLFDEVCGNRIVWGAQEYREIRFRHTVSAPDKWLHNIAPILTEYANSSVSGVEETIKLAQQTKVHDDLDKFMKSRFNLPNKTIELIKEAHDREESRPIETLWDLTTGITAYAKSIEFQDDRVEMERIGGRVLDLVAA